MKNVISLVLVASIASACSTATQHRADVQDDATDRITVGVVQKEIRIGMSGADVVGVIGSPNIVSTDSDRNEVWVYAGFDIRTPGKCRRCGRRKREPIRRGHIELTANAHGHYQFRRPKPGR